MTSIPGPSVNRYANEGSALRYLSHFLSLHDPRSALIHIITENELGMNNDAADASIIYLSLPIPASTCTLRLSRRISQLSKPYRPGPQQQTSDRLPPSTICQTSPTWPRFRSVPIRHRQASPCTRNSIFRPRETCRRAILCSRDILAIRTRRRCRRWKGSTRTRMAFTSSFVCSWLNKDDCLASGICAAKACHE